MVSVKRLHSSDATDHPPVVLVVTERAWVDERAVDVHAVGEVTTEPRSGTIAPVGITAADRRTSQEAGIDEVVRI